MRDDFALRVEVHVRRRSGGGLLAVVDEVGFAGVHADEHEAAAADVAGLGKDDGEGESDGDGGVDCVAAGFEDFDAGVGGVVVDGDDHGVLGGRGRRADDGVGIGHGGLGCRAGLGWRRRPQDERQGKCIRPISERRDAF